MKTQKFGRRKHDSYFYFLILTLMIWNNATLVAYVKSILIRIPGMQQVTYIFTILVYIFLVLLSFKYLIKRIRYSDLAFIAMCVITYISTMLLYSKTEDYLVEMFYYILVVNVPTYFVGLALDLEDESFIDVLHITSVLSVFLQLVAVAYIEGLTSQFDNLEKAYRILPHVCMVVFYLVKKFNWADLIAAILGYFQLIIYGTRGAILLAILFALGCYILKTKSKYRFLISGLIAAVSGIALLNINKLALAFSQILSKYGFNTRIFDRINQSTFLVSDGRNYIKEVVFEAIRRRPFVGYGVAGDRGVLIDYFGTFAYSHNLLYEFLVSYGCIIGFALFIALVILLLRAFYINKNRDQICLIMVLIFSSGFLKMFFSSSYLLEQNFFFLIGICVSTIRSNKSYKIRTNNLNY